MPAGSPARIGRRQAAIVDADALVFTPVTRETWPRFEALFESPGAPKHCWCMVWRRSAEEAKLQAGADRKRMMKERVDTATPVGLLASAGDKTVGWVSIGPRESHRNLGGPAAQPGERIWSLACFYVPRRFRGQALVHRLVAGAVDHARQAGATMVEAYPVDADAPSYRFMGFVETFAAAGFTEVGRAGIRRHVMRFPLT